MDGGHCWKTHNSGGGAPSDFGDGNNAAGHSARSDLRPS